jgi:carbon storage regulator
MLVLSRKIGERILVGDQVIITVTAIGGARVRLGITAPPHVSIRREELDAAAGGAAEVPAVGRTPPRPDR